MQSGTGGQILKRKGYTLSYNADYKTPQWVAWELTKKETKGKEGRTDKFLPDPDIRGAKAYTGDYTKSCLLYTSTPKYETTAKMLWDDEYLYVGAVLQEEDIKARLTQRDTTVSYTHLI